VTDRGVGEPVLLITGWTISSAVFDPVAELYLPHVRVIAYDHRGAGRSAPWPAPVSMAMLAADAARVLDDRGIAAAHVVGLSMGACVALELAIRMPQRVKSLVLVGGGAGGPTTTRPTLRAAAGTLGNVVEDTIRHRRVWPAAALFSEDHRKCHPDTVAAQMPFFARHRAPPWTTGWQTVAVACFGRRASLEQVQAATLVLHGGRDAMTPVANAQLLADGIPRAELHIASDAGHAVPLEHPEVTAELLVGWVRRHSGAQTPPPRRCDALGERVTRPFSLQAGALRNTRDAAASVARVFRPGRP
jgi:pimeloyl-ACP methyl ester carboxylesterase